jgi:uncharacterized surface protein with fasciclin (FAS1) repeats
MADATLGADDAKLNIFYDTADGIEFNGDAQIVDSGAEIEASNGVIHIVDGVINLPTVATFLNADPVFQSLDEALEGDDQPDFETVFETPAGTSPAPFTVFAPVNEAFASLAEVPSGEDLTAVLQHHVVAENNIILSNMDTVEGMESATLEGDTLQFSQTGNVVIITDGAGNSSSEVIPQLANIQAANGIVHGISNVLLPNTDDNDGDVAQ